ncbi:shikimate dehydrogenase family protein [Ferruginibacter profundus]
MKVYGIIGYPLGHSFSKKYFTEKFIAEGIADCAYEVFPLQSIEELRPLLVKNPALCGLNITIPHKQSVLAYLDDRPHLPATLSACNCIRIKDGKLSGYNTDIIGFEKSLLPQLKNYHTHALILGNGGAAEAVKFVLNKLNIGFKVVSRKLHEGSDLTYADLDEKIINEHLLIINTTPLGTFPNVDECPAIPYNYLTSKHFLYDLVYNPYKTLFLQKGEEHGAATKNGYDMLVIQAEESWRIWNAVE